MQRLKHLVCLVGVGMWAAGFILIASQQPRAQLPAVNSPVTDVAGAYVTLYRAGYIANVDLNTTNTDTAVPMTLATGHAKYRLQSVLVSNIGTTASLTTATAGVFSSTGGGGLALCATASLAAITSNSDDADTSMNAMSCTVGNRTRATFTTIYFRNVVAQGAAASANVSFYVQPLN